MQQDFSNRRWLCSKEAAEYLGCHPGTLAQDRLNGRKGIPFSRLGVHVRYDRAELDAYLAASRTVPVNKNKKKR